MAVTNNQTITEDTRKSTDNHKKNPWEIRLEKKIETFRKEMAA